jgi:hypothetical protein
LRENALHLETLASMEVQMRGALVFAFDAIRLLGIVECGQESDTTNEALLLRILTPLVKLYTGITHTISYIIPCHASPTPLACIMPGDSDDDD